VKILVQKMHVGGSKSTYKNYTKGIEGRRKRREREGSAVKKKQE
jgi:hypothetical protein